jgi:hypothetical protein
MRRFLTYAAFPLVGLLLTFALAFAAEHNERMASLLSLLWLPVIYGGTLVLPSSITAPYDPVGHPALYVLAFLVNAALFALIVFGLWRRAGRSAAKAAQSRM